MIGVIGLDPFSSSINGALHLFPETGSLFGCMIVILANKWLSVDSLYLREVYNTSHRTQLTKVNHPDPTFSTGPRDASHRASPRRHDWYIKPFMPRVFPSEKPGTGTSI